MRKFLLSLAVILSCSQAINSGVAVAQETTANKVQDQVGDTKTGTKKLVRTSKRKVRKATGNDNVLKDVKDKANDAGDDISNSANKIKRKNN